MKTINLESGKPPVRDALSRLDRELAAAQQHGAKILKLIHGYGSSGVGGDIRIALQKRLRELQDEGKIRAPASSAKTGPPPTPRPGNS
jgi:hypothetical protein